MPTEPNDEDHTAVAIRALEASDPHTVAAVRAAERERCREALASVPRHDMSYSCEDGGSARWIDYDAADAALREGK
mgnify:CR=1 FL=1